MSEAAKSFRDLIVWQKAHAFTLEIYRVTDAFPAAEKYGAKLEIVVEFEWLFQYFM